MVMHALNCIILSKRLREIHSSVQRELVGKIHPTSFNSYYAHGSRRNEVLREEVFTDVTFIVGVFFYSTEFGSQVPSYN